MPDQEILRYYDAVAPKILPYLRGRRVGVRHMFDPSRRSGSPRAGSRGDHTFVFRRHPAPLLAQLRRGSARLRAQWPEKNWMYIPNKKVLLGIVRQHGYEFFSHLEGTRDLWFALDMDIRAVPLPLGKIVVRTVVEILDERRVKYLLTFSGSNGFHLRWAFRRGEVPTKKWNFLRGIVRNLRDETERRLQESVYRDALYHHIPKTDPITELNAMDTAAQRSVLFDELILKPQATIRAPFSLHLGSRAALSSSRAALVAVPVEPRRLEAFVPATDATMSKGQLHPPVRLPSNPVAIFQRPPWS